MRGRLLRGLLSFILVLIAQVFIPSAFANIQELDDDGRAFFLAKSAYDDGFLIEARDQLLALVRANPETRYKIETYYLLGQCAMGTRNWERAGVHFRRVLRMPENPFQEKALYYLGLSQYRLGQHAAAAQAMQELLANRALSGFRPMAHWTLAKIHQRTGQEKAAREILGQLAKESAGTRMAGWAKIEESRSLEAQGEQRETKAALEILCSVNMTENPLQAGALELWRGALLERLGKAQEAIQQYGQAEQSEWGDAFQAQALMRKARLLQRQGDTASVQQAYETLIKKFPRSRWHDAAKLGLAQEYLLQNNIREAARQLKGINPRRGPGSLQEGLSLMRARLLLAKADYDKAIAAYSRFVSRFTASVYAPFARYELAWALEAAGRRRESLAYLSEYLDEDAPVALKRRVLFLKATALTGLGDWNKAIELYKTILVRYTGRPGNARVLCDLAVAFGHAGNAQQAQVAWEKMLKDYPGGAYEQDALYRLGRLAAEQSEWARAADYFNRLNGQYPDGAYGEQALYEEAVARHRLNAWDKAAERYEALLQRYPKSVWAQNALAEGAWALASAGREQQAAEKFEALLKKFPESPEAPAALFWLGQYALTQSRFTDAQNRFNQMLQRHATHDLADDAAYARATALSRMGKHEEAIAALNKLLVDHPNTDIRQDALFLAAENEAARKNYARAIRIFSGIATSYAAMRAADCHAARTNFTRALDGYAALQDDADPAIAAQARFKKALLLETVGQPLAAKNELLAVLALSAGPAYGPWPGKAALQLGEILEREGRWAEALTAYGKWSREPGQEGEMARSRMEQIKQARQP